jgi:hypothetical protein
MSIKTLYISHQYYNWKNYNCQWLNESNLQQVLNSNSDIDCKTTPEDLGYTNIDTAVTNADVVRLVDFDFLRYNNNNFPMYGRLLNALQKKTNSKLIDIDTNFLKVTTRKDKPVLWTAGCSITEALDVDEEDTWRYQLGQQLQREVLNLSKGGTSIWWSADQILRSDIRSGDIVVWGLTNVARIEYSKNWNMVSNTFISYEDECKQKYWTVDYFESETQTLFCLRSIYQVINFCNKVGADLYIINMLDLNWISSLLKSHPNFLDLVEGIRQGYIVKFIDYARDQLHPGPEQHKHFANKIYQFIKEKHYGNQTL